MLHELKKIHSHEYKTTTKEPNKGHSLELQFEDHFLVFLFHKSKEGIIFIFDPFNAFI